MRQAIHFELTRSGVLTGNEIALLHVVNSYSSYCAVKMQTLADMLNWSVRKVRYVMNSLVSKGALKKRYTYYKRIVLRVADLQEQANLFGLKAIKAAMNKGLKSFGKRYDRQKSTSPDRQKSTQPTKNKTLEEQKTVEVPSESTGTLDPRTMFAEVFSKLGIQ